VSTGPRVSIGLPVYNGEAYLASTIESILEQSFRDFELIISDNASTDGTEEICRTIAERDPRVAYYRNDENVGAANNFNLTLARAEGEYFKWAAHDDRIAPDFLARCVEALDGDPSAVLAYSGIQVIDSTGAVRADYRDRLPNVISPSAHRRFADLILIDHRCYEVFGLIRTEVLRQTPAIGSYIASDRVLLAELGLRGRFREVPEPLFFSRDHSERSLRAMPFHFRAAWFDPANRGRRVLPHWRFFREYFGCLRRVNLPVAERLRCYLVVLRWPIVNMNWARLAADLVAVVAPRAVPAMLSVKDRVVKPHSELTER
jgi:glycosyltransferase involved in cell wall biosynthesis